MKITAKQLQLFTLILKYNNLSHAAEKLFVSQAAASSLLSELENRLQTRLFDRVGKRLVMNEEGKNLLPHALAVIGRMEEIEQQWQSSKAHGVLSVLAGQITLGASTTIGDYVLPSLLSKFTQQYPQVKIKLQVANTEIITNGVKNFTLDLGFIEGPCNDAVLLVNTWQTDEICLVAAPHYIKANHKILTHKQLQKLSWVMREMGSGTRVLVEKHLNQYLSDWQVQLELGSGEAVKAAIIAGAGVGFLSHHTIQNSLQDKELIKVKSVVGNITRPFSIVSHPNKYSTAVLRGLKEALFL